MARHHRGPAQVALAGDRLCALCPQPASPKVWLCTDHVAELDHMLDPSWPGDPARRIPASIPVYWARLDPAPSSSGLQNRRAPGFVSTPPCSLDTVVMRDPRSRPNAVVDAWYTRLPNGKDDVDRPHHESDGQPRPVEVALANVALELWMDWGYHGPDLPNGDITTVSRRKAPWRVTPGGRILPPVTSLVHAHAAWLHHHRQRIAARQDVGPIHTFLTEVLHQLRVACRDEPERPEGRCDRWLPRPGGERVLCNGSVYRVTPRPDQDEEDVTAECERCGKPFGRLQVYRMKKINAQCDASPSPAAPERTTAV